MISQLLRISISRAKTVRLISTDFAPKAHPPLEDFRPFLSKRKGQPHVSGTGFKRTMVRLLRAIKIGEQAQKRSQ